MSLIHTGFTSIEALNLVKYLLYFILSEFHLVFDQQE